MTRIASLFLSIALCLTPAIAQQSTDSTFAPDGAQSQAVAYSTVKTPKNGGAAVGQLPIWTATPNILGSATLVQNGQGYFGITTSTPTEMLDVSNGNAIVRGIGNFTTNGYTASLAIGDTNHGIKAINGTGIQIGAAFSNPLQIDDFTGYAYANAFFIYSSKRWKTNIQPLHGALDKVEHLQGVSYDFKNNGRHQIGLIAEDVGKVVPEVVEYEKNGKDARGIDYPKLTALLIEATKEQQKMIQKQAREISSQQAAFKVQQTQLAHLSGQLTAVQSMLVSDHAEQARTAGMAGQVKSAQSRFASGRPANSQPPSTIAQLATALISSMTR